MNGNKGYLLDTNIIIGIFSGDRSIMSHLEINPEISVPSIGIGELYYGAHKSNRMTENINNIEAFVSGINVLSCDASTALHYGKIKNDLKQAEHPIPENDIWIAALAIQYDLILITRDVHFTGISNLRVEVW